MSIDESTFFREMTLRICGSLDIDQALESAFATLRRSVPADAVGLGFNNLDAARLWVVAKARRPGTRYVWTGEADEFALSPALVAHIRAQGAVDPVTLVNRPDQQPPVMHEAFPGFATHSVAFVTLGLQGDDIGVLLVSSEGHDRYTDAHARLLETIREPFAIAMANARRFRELRALKERLADDHRALSDDLQRAVADEVVGADFGLRPVMEQVRQVARSTSPTLLLGETGTGKEVVAHAIHAASPRSGGPMITMQCGAVPESLFDSELFGHERGAFTGADRRRRGRFERAHGGTLFLDEIGELSPEAQVKLLRVIQERCFERVGGSETVEVDVRVIAATHRDLDAMVREGRFREDLWYRLNVLPIRIPPLRLRREDIPSLVRHFVERKANEMNLQRIPRVTSSDLHRLQRYDWPGNVRELQNVVERALILSPGGSLVFPPLGAVRRPGAPARERMALLTMDEAMAAHIRAVLEHTDGQVAGPGGAAEVLDMNPSTLRFRMKKLGLAGRPRSRGR